MHLPITLTGSPLPIPLNADFGHAPLGDFGKRSEQAVPADAPRLGDATDRPRVPGCALGSRLLNMLSPPKARQQARILEALTDSSMLVAQLLGKICDAPRYMSAGLATKKLLHRLASTAAPLTRQGVQLSGVLRHRVEVHVLHMTASQLLTLRDGLACVRQSPDISQQDEIQLLAVVRDVVGRALAAHAQALLTRADASLLPALQQAVAQLPREAAHPGAAAQPFATLWGMARELLRQQGYAQYAPEDRRAMQRELVQAFCNQAVHNAAITNDQLCALLQALPVERQVQLGQITRQILHTPPTLFLRALQQASQQWLHEAQQRLYQAYQALQARPALTGSALTEQVVRLETALNQLCAYLSARGERLDPVLSEMFNTVFPQIEATLLQPTHLPLAALDNRSLRDLGLSMTRMRMDGTAQRVAHAIRQRQAAADLPYARAMHALAEALRDRDFTAALGRLAEAADRCEQAAGIYRQLASPLAPADPPAASREKRMHTTVQQWDRSTLLALRTAMDQPVSCALVFTLEQLGKELLQGAIAPQDANTLLGKQLLEAHQDLQMLHQAVVAQLGQHGIQPPSVIREIYGPADLDAHALGALRSVCARSGITLRLAGTTLQAFRTAPAAAVEPPANHAGC